MMETLVNATNGKKSKAGAALIALGAILSMFGYPEYGDIVVKLGEALGIVGIAHKVEKAAAAVQ